MKKILHKNEERGGGDFGWLRTKYSFSFANYLNKDRMGFGALRVVNDDWIAPGAGFPDHSHQNMEIFTIPLSGYLRHQDSIDKSGIITRGDVQIMSAGHGVTHSEFNDSFTEPVELLQVWITPNTKHLQPRYEDRFFPHQDEKNVLHPIITPTGEQSTLRIHQDAYVYLGTFDKAMDITYSKKSNAAGVFIFNIEGEVSVAGTTLSRRDSLEITDAHTVDLSIQAGTEILVIEVPLI